MARLTTQQPGGDYTVAPGQEAAALARLGAFEDIHDQLAAQQLELSAKLEALRLEGKKSSVKFRELLSQKLQNSIVLSTFQARGL